MPLTKPALGTLAIFTFTGVWDDFLATCYHHFEDMYSSTGLAGVSKPVFHPVGTSYGSYLAVTLP